MSVVKPRSHHFLGGYHFTKNKWVECVRPAARGEQRQKRIQQYLDFWYKSRALARLTDKTNSYADQIGVSPSGIRVSNFRSRWGSCDPRGQLLFNWNIIKVPHAVAEYVVLHELCHLVHPNHIKDFWAFVQRFDPAFRQHRNWLKHQGHGLL